MSGKVSYSIFLGLAGPIRPVIKNDIVLGFSHAMNGYVFNVADLFLTSHASGRGNRIGPVVHLCVLETLRLVALELESESESKLP